MSSLEERAMVVDTGFSMPFLPYLSVMFVVYNCPASCVDVYVSHMYLISALYS